MDTEETKVDGVAEAAPETEADAVEEAVEETATEDAAAE